MYVCVCVCVCVCVGVGVCAYTSEYIVPVSRCHLPDVREPPLYTIYKAPGGRGSVGREKAYGEE